MTEKALTKSVILDTAERELIQYGWSRTTLVSIAKSLAVSHAALYSYFRSKAALRDALLERWLLKYSEQLAVIAEKEGNMADILYEWFSCLFELKKKEFTENEELFLLHRSLVQQKNAVIQKHEDRLVDQLEKVIRRGMDGNEFIEQDSLLLAKTIFGLMSSFYHPAFSERWKTETIRDEFDKAWEIVSRGMVR